MTIETGLPVTSPLPAIEVRGLCKRFGAVVAVDRISFTVRAGSTCALLGGNGAGKTTTISMLLGLLLPTAGGIRILGVDMLTERYRVLPRMSFTSPYVDLPRRLTVRQNLTVYGHLYGITRLRRRIDELAQELELVDLLDRTFGALSSGQRTRVNLAKSLLNEPQVLLMDEPTASLDPDTADRIRAYLRQYQRRTNATLLLATHNMQEVERLCDNVLMMRAGHIVDEGSPDGLAKKYGRATLEQVFLDIARQRRNA